MTSPLVEFADGLFGKQIPEGSPFVLRLAEDVDVEALVGLKSTAAARAYGFAEPDTLASWLAARCDISYIEAKLCDAATTTYVLERDGWIVAMACLRVVDDIGHFGDLYCVIDGTGAGRFLLDACVLAARSAGATSLSCHCFEKNVRAQVFLMHYGFSVVGAVPAQDDLGAGELFELRLPLS